jgi:hypothetical protein
MTRLDGAFTLLDAFSKMREAARIFDAAGDSDLAIDCRNAAEALALMAEVAVNRHKTERIES